MAAEIKHQYGAAVKLTPGSRGIFDVVSDGQIIYSKFKTHRFPNHNEVVEILKATGPGSS